MLLDLIATILIPARAPVMLAVDDTLWRRTGRKLHGAALYAPLPARPPLPYSCSDAGTETLGS